MNAGNSAAMVVAARDGHDDPAQAAAKAAASHENEMLSDYLYIICGAIAVAVIAWKIIDIATKWTRTVVCLNNDRQRYFALPSPNLARLKRHILYAPVLGKRHNREIQISTAINVGTLPTRFQLLFLVAYFATNVAFCVIEIPFTDSYENVARLVRNRTGVLSVINMVCGPRCFASLSAHCSITRKLTRWPPGPVVPPRRQEQSFNPALGYLL